MSSELDAWRRDLAQQPEEALRALIRSFVRNSPENRLRHLDGGPIFEEPLVAYADGDDPLFMQYKSEAIIGPFHLTPREVWQAAPQGEVAPARLSVVAYILPISEATRASNRAQAEAPSARWAHTRTYGEQFNDVLRRYVVRMLQEAGYWAVAPVLSPGFGMLNEGIDHAPASTWSERHIMYAAGLGTFSLSDGLITPVGMAMRCGSVVTDLLLRASPRPYANHTANCLYLAQGRCGKCIARCPAGAITTRGHDKQKCQAYAYGTLEPYKERYGVSVVGCGLCQTGVPCECRIPDASAD